MRFSMRHAPRHTTCTSCAVIARLCSHFSRRHLNLAEMLRYWTDRMRQDRVYIANTSTMSLRHFLYLSPKILAKSEAISIGEEVEKTAPTIATISRMCKRCISQCDESNGRGQLNSMNYLNTIGNSQKCRLIK